MRLLDRYILKEFIHAFFLAMFICMLILVISMLFDTFEDIIEQTPKWYYIAGYFINRLPYKMIQAIPIVTAVSVMFSMGLLAKNNETLAIFTSGVSEARVSLPLIGIAVLISLGALYAGETLVPDCEDRARRIEKIRIEGKSESYITRNKDIFVKGKGNRFYVMKSFDQEKNTMTLPSIIDLSEDGSKILRRIDATRATLVVKGETKSRYWRFENMVLWRYSPEGYPIAMETYPGGRDIPMEENLEKFLSADKEPDKMNFSELRRYIVLLKERGDETNYYKTALMTKIAFPLSPVIIVVIGFYLAVNANPRKRIINFAAGILSAIAYFIVSAFFVQLGYKNSLPAIVASWLPNVLFIGLAIMLIMQAHSVRRRRA